MAWLLLFLAGLFEVGWAIGLKYTRGFTELWPTLGTAAALVISMVLLERAVRVLPIGTAYAVWVGIGAFGTAVLGIVLLGESRSALRIAFLLLLIVSIVGLKLSAPTADAPPGGG
jgi:quaternary ammonium compound-resistance protein SugE